MPAVKAFSKCPLCSESAHGIVEPDAEGLLALEQTHVQALDVPADNALCAACRASPVGIYTACGHFACIKVRVSRALIAFELERTLLDALACDMRVTRVSPHLLLQSLTPILTPVRAQVFRFRSRLPHLSFRDYARRPHGAAADQYRARVSA